LSPRAASQDRGEHLGKICENAAHTGLHQSLHGFLIIYGPDVDAETFTPEQGNLFSWQKEREARMISLGAKPL
jgi:hypothetical protein